MQSARLDTVPAAHCVAGAGGGEALVVWPLAKASRRRAVARKNDAMESLEGAMVKTRVMIN